MLGEPLSGIGSPFGSTRLRGTHACASRRPTRRGSPLERAPRDGVFVECDVQSRPLLRPTSAPAPATAVSCLRPSPSSWNEARRRRVLLLAVLDSAGSPTCRAAPETCRVSWSRLHRSKATVIVSHLGREGPVRIRSNHATPVRSSAQSHAWNACIVVSNPETSLHTNGIRRFAMIASW